tara:strand:+ start:1828 stop:2109 length:282 start_codon:yes stop_codon:yes gene_type:complete
MANYILIILSVLIFLIVIFITIKPLKTGIDAKQNKTFPKDKEILNLNNEIDKEENFAEFDNSISNELYRLKKLHDEGILTEEEFNKAKKRVLD